MFLGQTVNAYRDDETDFGALLRAADTVDGQERLSAEINAEYVGQKVEVLVEGAARRRTGWLAGKTPHFKTTVFPAATATPGDLVRVRVTDSTAHTLIAA